MKVYEYKETTPLRFFKFYRSILLPLGIFCGICVAIFDIYLLFTKTYNWYFILTSSLYLVFLILCIIVLIGLIRWKRYTVTFIFFFLVRDVLESLYSIINSSIIKHSFPLIPLTYGLIVCFLDVIIFIYFHKRRKLLNGVVYKIPKHRKTLKEYFAEDILENPEGAGNQELCQCGYPILDGYMSCPDCGREYENQSTTDNTDEEN